MLRGNSAASITVGALKLSVNTLHETRRAQEDFANPPDFYDVYAD
jgi:hypothetical protein